MDSDPGVTSYGECRCCLVKGNHRDMRNVYYLNGTQEVYFDMFKESLNLPLTKQPNLTTLICSQCVSRLREAHTFREMTAGTERLLLSTAKDNNPVFVNVEESSASDVDIKPEHLDVVVKTEGPESDDDDYCNDLVMDDFHEREASLLARFESVKLLPKRQDLEWICPKYSVQLDLLANLDVTGSMVSTIMQNRRMKSQVIPRNYVSEKNAQITNAITLIKYSNVTPFRSKSRTGFPCFYCRSIYEDFEELKKHTHSEHKPIELMKILKLAAPESMVVYVDVTDIKCSICNEGVKSLNDLKTHLKVHGQDYITNVSDRVVPFRVTKKFDCQLCECRFETFGSIERHMNGHYRNYVCPNCGSGFITKYRLKVHMKSMHTDGNFQCESCQKTFTTQQKYKNHVNTVHNNVKRFKCTKCPERFSEYFQRQKHLVEEHGVAPLKYTCNVCERSFDRRYTLSRHLKRDHLEERDFECEMCGYRCFTKNELKVHMIKHTGERIYECSVCNKSYARKKTLREHMRIHNNDRRFVCPACGQAFVQKCSLKGHLKTHHMEFNMP